MNATPADTRTGLVALLGAAWTRIGAATTARAALPALDGRMRRDIGLASAGDAHDADALARVARLRVWAAVHPV